MQTEVEAKFPDVDPQALRQRLRAAGAIPVHPEVAMRRKTFDYPDSRLEKIGGWVRVRDEGSQVTLSYKQLNERTLHGTQEVNVVVDSFDRACELLLDIGLAQRAYQETRRERWQLGEVEATIDTWPWIPTFVELEGPDEATVRTAAGQLGLDWGTAMFGSVEDVYQRHYDFTEAEIDAWPSITFTPEPEWLLARRNPGR